MKINIIFIRRIAVMCLLLSLSMNLAWAQKRTTSVKGYYRKNGTYVRPHTRGYSPGAGSISTGSSYVSSVKEEESNNSSDITPSILKLINIRQGNHKDSRNVEYYEVQGQKIGSTKLNIIESDSIPQKSRDVSQGDENVGVVFYVSVLRYNGKTIDVCPIARSTYSGWAFDKVNHKFKKNKITTEDALDLVANHGWSIAGEEISKDFSYSYGNKVFPKYLTKVTEAINVE